MEGVRAYAYPTENTTDFRLFYHGYKNWDYGYTCYFPNVEINDLKIFLMAENREDRTPLPSGFAITFMNFSGEYDMHLSTTKKTAPTRIWYNETTGLYEQKTNVSKTGYVNDNPIKPPEFIRILNNTEGYDYFSSISGYMNKSTFFNLTRISEGTKINGIITETKVLNQGRLTDETPILPFD